MAKVTRPLMSIDASSAFADTMVYAKWKGINYSRQYAIPSKHNEAKPVKHNYILNGGLLWCEKCGKEMEGRSGTGAKGVRYYYYICKNKERKFKVPADKIDGVILKRIKELSTQKDIMADIIKSTNEKLQKELPQLKEQKNPPPKGAY